MSACGPARWTCGYAMSSLAALRRVNDELGKAAQAWASEREDAPKPEPDTGSLGGGVMKVPLSWLKDFVDLTLDIPELAHRLTLAGLEVEEIRFVGLPIPPGRAHGLHETKVSGLSWDPETIVVGRGAGGDAAPECRPPGVVPAE